MTLYVVVDLRMSGRSAWRGFLTRQRADAFLKAEGFKGQVEAHSVHGDPTGPQAIYAAHSYDQMHDIHHLEGLYTSHEDAAQRAGEKGISPLLQVEWE